MTIKEFYDRLGKELQEHPERADWKLGITLFCGGDDPNDYCFEITDITPDKDSHNKNIKGDYYELDWNCPEWYDGL